MNEKNGQSVSKHIQPTFKLSLVVIAIIVAIMFTGIMVLKTISIQSCLIVIITIICIISSFFLKYTFDDLIKIISESVKEGTFGFLFFIAIGGIIASWMMSGTVPVIIYYGTKIISPKIFLPASLILCSLTALSIGTSWGTVGTMGIALVGIGQGMGIPAYITAGAVVSGATFGDKLSPVSDTPNMTSMISGSELFSTIKAMITTMLPAYIISLIMFAIVGFKYADKNINYEIIKETQFVIANNFNLNPVVLLPVVLLIIFSIKKVPSLFTMVIAIASAMFVAVLFQGQSVGNCVEALNSGFVINTGSKYVDPILNRGGLKAMLDTFSLAFLAICMGGILDKCGYLRVIVKVILKKISSVGALAFTVLSTSLLSTAFLGEVYLSFILNGTIYREEFDKCNLNRSMLARLVSEGALMMAPLMPWTTFGAFCMATFGVSGLKFAPYAFLSYLSPIVSLLMTYMGIGIVWNNPNNKCAKKFLS